MSRPARRRSRHPVGSHPRPPALAVTGRAVVVATSTLATGLPALAGAGVRCFTQGREPAKRYLYQRIVRQVERLGPTYIKFGQILGTRRDVLPITLCEELGRLHADVRPLEPGVARQALIEAYGPEMDLLFAQIDLEAVSSGSIASVYRALLPNGEAVALKLRRPGIRRRMLLDLAALTALIGFAGRVPPFRGAPTAELAGYIADAVLRQLDFDVERENLTRLRKNFSAADEVWIPRTMPELSRPNCVVMEFIPGLVHGPVAQLTPERRAKLAARTLQAVYQMLFLDGFVHCDLHPGNVYFVGPRVVVLDAGFSVQLPPTVRRQFADFFLGMALGRGRRCGEIVAESSLGAAPDADIETFVAAVADLVIRNSGVPAKEFRLLNFGTQLFALQRDHGLYAASEFVFPLMSLLVIEGTIRELDPDVDFQAVARPLLLRAAAAWAGAPD